MSIIYHSGAPGVIPGTAYIGSDRERLSEFLGGPLAFGYPFPFGNWELGVDDRALCIASLNTEYIPRIDYDCCTFEEAIGKNISNIGNVLILENDGQTRRLPFETRYAYGAIAEVLRLEPQGEIAVLAETVRFLKRR